MFDPDKHTRKIRDIAPLLIDGGRYVSCDYGTQNATVFLLWNKGIDGIWYCIREYYHSGRETKQKSGSAYADDFEAWLDGTAIQGVIIDPAATSFAAELNERGYKTIKAANEVTDGIRLTMSLLNRGKIMFSRSCTDTIKEFASYIWDVKAADRGEDAPVKQHDHAMDAVGYFSYTILNNKRVRIKKKSSYGLS